MDRHLSRTWHRQPPASGSRRLADGLRFVEDGRCFNYRVAGVLILDGRLLVHRAAWEPFWTLPGSRAEFFEYSTKTLRRRGGGRLPRHRA